MVLEDTTVFVEIEVLTVDGCFLFFRNPFGEKYLPMFDTLVNIEQQKFLEFP